MGTSKTIAGLIGPTLIACAASIFLNYGTWPTLVDQAFHDPPFVFVSGLLLFVAGLSIVRAHNRWRGGWPVLVTVLGWLAVLSGLTRILLPTHLGDFATSMVQRTGVLFAAAAFVLLLGTFLCVKAYSRD